MTQKNETLPRWDLSNVYPGLDSPEFKADLEALTGQIDALDGYLADLNSHAPAGAETVALGQSAGELVRRTNNLLSLYRTLRAYMTGFTAVDSFNTDARRIESQLQVQGARIQDLYTRFRAWVGHLEDRLEDVIAVDPTAGEHAFALREAAELSLFQMSPAEESLASQLSLSGGMAWGKLQGTVTSQKTVEFELDGEVRPLPMPALINLRSHPDEAVRRRAYDAENVAWESLKEPLVAAINGVKGETVTLAKRRGYADVLQIALQEARIDRETLDAMLSAMADSFPAFRRYFHAKARRMGKQRLAWWDLFAPSGNVDRVFSWQEARGFVLEHFAAFSPDLADFARHAFDANWIDAEQRPGKRGGAFCMGVPGVKESRVLTNFDGSLDQVSTVAHELGHAFHNQCIYAAGKTLLQSDTPMTLAETASIMNETIVQQAALAHVSSAQEELGILETALIGDSQVIVDIYSRFLFEREVFTRREKAELSADELNEIMAWAQKETYGDGLDEQYLQPFMWTWKPHYYSSGLPYYNFPYAFGLLFGVGLYAIYRQRGASFVPDYVNLLASTGDDQAANLAARFGIDIRSKGFWADSLKVIEERIDRYEVL